MARHDLIDDYLARLAAEVAWRPDADDVVAEARDHLYSATDERVAGGEDPDAAQQRALARFGEPAIVARSMAETRGLAVPTAGTRSAGQFAMFAALAWALVPALWWSSQLVEGDDGWGTRGQALFVGGTLALLTATALTAGSLVGLYERHGGRGVVALVSLGFSGLAVAASLLSWFWLGWATLTAIGLAVSAIVLLPHRLAPRAPLLAMGFGWVLGLAAFGVLRVLQVGATDEWGDYPVATNVGLGVGALVTAIGLLGIGRWLAGEEPVVVPTTGPVPAR